MINLELPTFVEPPKITDYSKFFRSVKSCEILKSGIHPVFGAYHICSCDPERIYCICEECFKVCHLKKGHESIHSYNSTAVCMCGMKCHQPMNEELKSDMSYTKECLFGEWSVVTNMNFMYESSDTPKAHYCIFCYNFCQKEPRQLTPITINSPKQAKCECRLPNHNDIRIIFRKLKSLSKEDNFLNKYDFEGLGFVHFANLITLAKESYQNIFHSFDEGIANTFTNLETSQYYALEDHNVLNDLHLTSNVISNFALKCKKCLYFNDKIKKVLTAEVYTRIIDRKFDIKSWNIWQLNYYLSNIFWKFYIARDFARYPNFKVRDVELLNPIQRIMMISNIKSEISMIEYTNNIRFNLLDSIIQLIHKLSSSKEKKEEAYLILHRLYQACQVFAKYSLFNHEQLERFCNINDEVLAQFEECLKNEKQSNMITNSQLKVLSSMVKSLLHLAYYYNDQFVLSYLKSEKKLNSVHFFHTTSEIGIYTSRNAINILTFIRHVSSRENVDENDEEKKSIGMNDALTKKTTIKSFTKLKEKCLRQIVENANNIISLTISNPDYYSTTLQRIFDKNQEIWITYLDNSFDSVVEENFVRNLRHATESLENAYCNYFSYYNSQSEIILITKCVEIFKDVMKECKITENTSSVRDYGSAYFEEDKFIKEHRRHCSGVDGASMDYLVINKDSKQISILPKKKTFVNALKNTSTDQEISSNEIARKLRILFNKTYFIQSMVKIVQILYDAHLNFEKSPSGFVLDLNLISNMSKILAFYVKGNPDNAMALLCSDFTSVIELVTGDNLYQLMEVVQSALQNIFVMKYEFTSSRNILHMVKVIARRVANSTEYIGILDKVIKIIQFLVRIAFVNEQNVQRKLRNILKEIFRMNSIFRNYFIFLLSDKEKDIPGDKEKDRQGGGKDRGRFVEKDKERDKDKQAPDSDRTDTSANQFKGYDITILESVIKKLLRIVNLLFDGDATLNELEFLQNIFRRDEIPKILRKKSIDISLRTEIIKFFRIVYVDVILNCKKLSWYRSLVINDPVVPSEEDNIDNADLHKLYEEMILVGNQDVVSCMDLECAVLKFELKFCTEIIQMNGNVENRKKLEYVEYAIILPLCVYMSKFVSIIFNLTGYDYMRLYDLVYHFLLLKKYVMSNQSIFTIRQVYKYTNIFKNKFSSFGNETLHLIKSRYTEEDMTELEKDISEMNMQHFEILNFATVNGIFKKHIDSFISKPNMKGLKDLFEKKKYVYSPDQISKKIKKLREVGMMKTPFEEKVFDLIIKYLNEKNQLDQSYFKKMLEEDNSYYDLKYRFLLVRNCLFLMSEENWMEKYRDSSLWLLFRLLQYDTVPIQNVCYGLYKKGSKMLDFQILVDNFTANLISIFFKQSNPSLVMENTDYFMAIIIIKIFKYLCEEHNKKFQKIFFKEVKVKYSNPCTNLISKNSEQTAAVTINGKYSIHKHSDEKSQKENTNTLTETTSHDDCESNEQKVTVFEFMLSILTKIILISKWDSHKTDAITDSYYYDIFFVIIEFVIETIQGTERANFEAVFKKLEDDAIDEQRNIFGTFLLKIKNVLFEGNPESEILYKVRNAIINFIMAFLEEKSTPNHVVIEISSIILPNSVMDSIVSTMFILFKKLNLGNGREIAKDPSTNELLFTPQMQDMFTHIYFTTPHFFEQEEFALANRMYQYFKLLATEEKYKNEQAASFFAKMSHYTEEDVIKHHRSNPESRSIDKAMIDNGFYNQYWCAKFFEKITRTIFVQLGNKNEKTTVRVLFTLHPLLPELSKNTQLDFLEHVDRSDRYVKLFALMENCEYFYDEIINNQNRSKKNRLLIFLQGINFYYLEAFAFIITFLLNCIMISDMDGIGEAYYGDKNTVKIIEGFAIANAVLNGLFITMWLYSKFLLVYRIESKKAAQKKQAGSKEDNNNNNTETSLSFWNKLHVLYMVLIGRNELTGFIWNVLFAAVAAGSTQNYFLFSVQMFIVINLSITLRNIILSITLKCKQFLATAIFVLLSCYIFACIAFFFLSEDFIVTIQGKPTNTYPENFSFLESITGTPVTEAGNIENECGTLFYCFITHIDYGLRTDGGIGEHLPKRSFTKDPIYYIARFFYNLFFFILVVVILLSVVFGVVIDAFAELRDSAQRVEVDKKNICFICGVKREKLEKNGVKFDEHITTDHNIWTYAEYIIGLRFLDIQETNAVNSYVMGEVEKKQIGWFPSQDERENGEENQHGEDEEKIE